LRPSSNQVQYPTDQWIGKACRLNNRFGASTTTMIGGDIGETGGCFGCEPEWPGTPPVCSTMVGWMVCGQENKLFLVIIQSSSHRVTTVVRYFTHHLLHISNIYLPTYLPTYLVVLTHQVSGYHTCDIHSHHFFYLPTYLPTYLMILTQVVT
jgi:hypothetical protein